MVDGQTMTSEDLNEAADGSRPGVVDEAVFIHEEDAKVEREVEEEEEGLSAR